MTDHALVIEAMLLRWGENHSSGRTVTLQLPEEDFPHPFKGMKCGPANGQRLAVSIALIDDDETETPVQQPDEATATPGEANKAAEAPCATKSENQGDLSTEPNRDPYHYQRQAGMRCNDKVFQQFFVERYPAEWYAVDQDATCALPTDKQASENAVRSICRVASRKEFDTDPVAAKRWRGLMAEFDVWRGVA